MSTGRKRNISKVEKQNDCSNNTVNQERAYVAASRRKDRNIEARIESAQRASDLHFERTGKKLKVDRQTILDDEVYYEVDVQYHERAKSRQYWQNINLHNFIPLSSYGPLNHDSTIPLATDQTYFQNQMSLNHTQSPIPSPFLSPDYFVTPSPSSPTVTEQSPDFQWLLPDQVLSQDWSKDFVVENNLNDPLLFTTFTNEEATDIYE